MTDRLRPSTDARVRKSKEHATLTDRVRAATASGHPPTMVRQAHPIPSRAPPSDRASHAPGGLAALASFAPWLGFDHCGPDDSWVLAAPWGCSIQTSAVY